MMLETIKNSSMKVVIEKNILRVFPENKDEENQLFDFYEKRIGTPVNMCVDFNLLEKQ